MSVVLDSKDVAKIDEEFAAESQIWQPLMAGAKAITEADFVGANEVRINKMSGFTSTVYQRNGDNTRTAINMEKETVKLTHEDWFGYDVDQLDESENAALTIQNIREQHVKLVSIPNKDKAAAQVLYDVAGKKVEEEVTKDNALTVYDAAEEYMTDNEIPGGYVMFVSASYYRALKNASGVSRSFTTNEMGINGINRKVAQLDGGVPIMQVSKSRLKGESIDGDINFILTPFYAIAPITKFSTIDLIPASQDPNGYRDKLKGLDYYDAIVFDNAKKAIYVSEAPKA
ncbi:capsid protein [Pediococcus pentosaceus]|mgnify:CR=1 FL=1|uniref:capsid protein n=1 Tax=Pediococcus pentosaceus TaxID=1255 RepID=UPI00223B1E77|nr:capsid protein [Pediococcus pentosaceus]MCS8562730.1 capsid protein [Pediococcus pentosaceus]MCS8566945.1 capsid protein [Pediococcus pentosaceus]MCS8579808.1 capsid protein [Pediococcus pentosaceus]MCT3032570.1 capsid protein [Pediococcus pentosaceus]WKF71874.1 capsid protein [Pediococcus pentosaceus]